MTGPADFLADQTAARVRAWLEANPETSWTRLWTRPARRGIVADNWALRLVDAVKRAIADEAARG